MSLETHEWLSQNTLIGFTDKRGHAWHHRATDSNTYPYAIPVEDVRSRLFDWFAQPHESTVQAPELRKLFVPDGHGGMERLTDVTRPVTIPNGQVLLHSGTHEHLGSFSNGYQPHQYGQWLINNVATLLHGELGISSAGLLRGGRQAWVSVEVPENFKTADGVVFRPFLMACTSFDGSLATTYKRGMVNVVCDNTMGAMLSGEGGMWKARHSAKSLTRIGEARDALELIYTDGDEFAKEIERLTSTPVSIGQWDQIRDEILAPLPKPNPKSKSTRGLTMAESKRSALDELYTSDQRVAPWAGSVWGVLQADNTYRTHFQTTKGMSREERNMVNAVEGNTAKADGDTVTRVLELVLT